MSPLDQGQEWLNSTRGNGEIERLFEHLPEVMFFAKNKEGVLMRASRAFVQHLGCRQVEEVIGKTDRELFPPFMANKFRADDLQVMERGEPLLNLLELFPSEHGVAQLHLTNKFPVFDQAGESCGVCGTVRVYENTQRTIQPYLDIQKAIDHIKKNYAEPLTVPELAALTGFSVRHFERKFQEVFHTTPRAYLLKIRVLRAAEFLTNTNQSITEIALQTGFYDHSSFTRQFRQQMNQTPHVYRRTHPSSPGGRG